MTTFDTITPDDVLLTELRRNPQLLDQMQRQATKLRHNAWAAFRSPTFAIDQAWTVFQRRTRHAAQGVDLWNLAARERSVLAQARIALEAIEHFSRYLEPKTEAERDAAWAADRQAAMRQALPPEPFTAPPPFDACGFIDGLARRGINLSASGKGLSVANANRLTDAERHAIAVNRSAIHAALASTVELF